MAEEISITIREAVACDAQAILALMQKVAAETEFLVIDENADDLSLEQFQDQLQQLQESSSNLLLLAFDKEQVIGASSIKTSAEKRIDHIGELGISLLKDYWGMGLGSYLMEEMLTWAQASGRLYRLELRVQAQNKRAIHLYEKFGFNIEAVMARGARGNEGEFLDVILMSKLLDPKK